ncbi:MAG: DNA-processing protein DprA [Planctomycetota bacterium]
MNDLLLTRLRLARTPGVGPRTALLLEERCGSPPEMFRRSAEELCACGVPPRIARALAADGPLREARAELEEQRRLGHRLLARGDPDYPEALEGLDDPPQVLSFRGELPLGGARAVAVVGARRATREGRDLAYQLGLELAAAGVLVVSGLARGIDTAAHEGALEAGGRTVAVLGSGLCEVYPRRNRGLAERIARQGALVSELPPRMPPTRHTFPQRNRIVTGLAWGVVVVQAGPRSGALLSADLALQQGRELFAVPGSVRDPLAQGTNALLKDGARLVTSARDVLDLLDGVQGVPDPEPPLSPAAQALLAHLEERAQDELELSTRAGLGPEDAARALGELLLWGQARRTPRGFALR